MRSCIIYISCIFGKLILEGLETESVHVWYSNIVLATGFPLIVSNAIIIYSILYLTFIKLNIYTDFAGHARIKAMNSLICMTFIMCAQVSIKGAVN